MGAMNSTVSIQPSDLRNTKKGLPPGKAIRYKENRYIHTAPVLRTPEEKELFLDILRKNGGYLTLAAAEFGCSPDTLERRRIEDPEFAYACTTIKRHYEQQVLTNIEKFSREVALSDKQKTTERAIHLNALDPAKYRPRQSGQGNVAIQINFGGFQVPKFQRSQFRSQVKAECSVSPGADISDSETTAKGGVDVGFDAVHGDIEGI